MDQKEDFAKVKETLLINMTANVVHALLAKTARLCKLLLPDIIIILK